MQTINLSNGHTLNFPDEMTDDDIHTAIQKEYGQQESSSSNVPHGTPNEPFKYNYPEATPFEDLEKSYADVSAGVLKGARGLGNAPSEFAKYLAEKGLIGKDTAAKVPTIPDYDFAQQLKLPDTPEDRNIQDLAQNIPGLMIPGVSIGKAGQLLSKIPAVGRFATRAIENAIPASAYAATQSPDSADAAKTAAETTLPFSWLSTLMSSNSPLVKLAARAGMVGLGAYGGHSASEAMMPGSGLADSAATGIGAALGMMGRNPQKEARDTVFKGVTPKSVEEKLAAAKRLGLSYLTPAEASGNRLAGAIQGGLGKTEKGSQILGDKGTERIETEKKSINDLYDTIFDEEKLVPEVKRLYGIAHSAEVPQEQLADLSKNEIFNQAASNVEKSPAYREALKGVPRNSLGYLDRVKQAMDDMIDSAPKKEARIIQDTRRDLLKKMDDISPEYSQARSLSERQITRGKVEDSLNESDERGTNFFSKVLKNDKKYNKLLYSLRNVPEVQQKLKDMRLVFEDLVNPPTLRTSAALAKTGMDQYRNSRDRFVQDLKEKLSGGKLDQTAVKLITSPDWRSELAKVGKPSGIPLGLSKSTDLIGRMTALNAASDKRKKK